MTAAVIRQIWHGIRAEAIRVGGPRGLLIAAVLPGAIGLPLVVTFGVAVVAERFSTLSGSVQVTSVTTTNSVYWIITFTATVWMLVAAYAQATADRGLAGEINRYLYPRHWTGPVARFLHYGTGAAVCALVLTATVLVTLPRAFPNVYGGVDITSPEGIRFLVTVPVYSVCAVAIGVGVAALTGHAAGAIALLLGWTYLVENAISLLPNGYTLQSWMPFLNGTFGTGQELAFAPPWGPNGALLYCAAVATAFMIAGCVAPGWRFRRTGSRGRTSGVRGALGRVRAS